MLGQCMLLVIASDMVNRMPIPSLMECKASDYAESQAVSRDMQTHICCCARFYVTINIAQ